MGVDTKGKIKAEHMVKDIQRALKYKFNIDSTLRDTSIENYYNLLFDFNDEKRMLSVFENYVDDETREIGTHLIMGMWGSSIKLMRGILETFGGHIIENDSEDEWQYVSPNNKINLTDDEILEDKLYRKLEGSNMNFVEKKRVIDYIKNNLDFFKTL